MYASGEVDKKQKNIIFILDNNPIVTVYSLPLAGCFFVASGVFWYTGLVLCTVVIARALARGNLVFLILFLDCFATLAMTKSYFVIYNTYVLEQ